MGTTKLTRKEILAEDPVHGAIIQLIDLFRENGKKIGIIAAIVVLVGIGIYGGIQYLDSRELQAQEILGKGMEFYHGQVAADATNDPYSKGASPTFRSDSDEVPGCGQGVLVCYRQPRFWEGIDCGTVLPRPLPDSDRE